MERERERDLLIRFTNAFTIVQIKTETVLLPSINKQGPNNHSPQGDMRNKHFT